MEQLNIALATIGVAVLVLGVLPALKPFGVTLPVAAFAIGILIGPVGWARSTRPPGRIRRKYWKKPHDSRWVFP